MGLSTRLLVTLILIKMALCTRFGELRVTLPLGVNKISQQKKLYRGMRRHMPYFCHNLVLDLIDIEISYQMVIFVLRLTSYLAT
jgi:hypothetical protein